MSDEVFSSDLPDLQGMIKKLDMFNENANKAVRTALHSGADKIVSEQKRLAPEKTREAISKGKVYTTKKVFWGLRQGTGKMPLKPTVTDLIPELSEQFLNSADPDKARREASRQ